MAKKVVGYIKLEVPAGQANPSPPIGPALGQRGLNIMPFCKDFNAASQEMEKGCPIPGAAYDHARWALSVVCARERGVTPGRALICRVTKDQGRSIAEQKLKDLNARDVEAAMR